MGITVYTCIFVCLYFPLFLSQTSCFLVLVQLEIIISETDTFLNTERTTGGYGEKYVDGGEGWGVWFGIEEKSVEGIYVEG